MCVYCNSNCTHLFFVHPRVIIAFCIFIKQDSACSTFGVEVCPNAGGMCGLEGFFCLWFVWLGFGHFWWVGGVFCYCVVMCLVISICLLIYPV